MTEHVKMASEQWYEPAHRRIAKIKAIGLDPYWGPKI